MSDNEQPKDDVTLAHAHCFTNRSEVLASEICGCFYCLNVFPPSAICNWIDEKDLPLSVDNVLVRLDGKRDQTAMCPDCGIDAVIGSRSGYSISIDFLKRMHARWFQQI